MSYMIHGETGAWEVIIGLEVHAQVTAKSKLFSSSSTKFGGKPNHQVSLIDAAMPGMLPIINKHCIEQAVKTGLGLRAKINLYSVFERKNYFYADLPQGYQISQYLYPIVGEGIVKLDNDDGTERLVGIERLHMEQDAGKSMHDQDPRRSLIDLNRSGICLMEIVSKPDIRSPVEAGKYLRKLRSIMRYLGTCDGNMAEGSMRADVNVSVRLPGENLRTRVEIKNVNSVRFVMQAIEIEAARQVELWEDGGEVSQETRLFDPNKGMTRTMRSKEFAHDYRYFPDPDLLPLNLTEEFVKEIQATLPELPDQKHQRFMNEFGLSSYDAEVLVNEKRNAEYFEEVINGKERGLRDPKVVVNWITTNLFGALKAVNLNIEESPISADQLGQLLDLLANETISSSTAKNVFELMFETGRNAADLVEERGLKQISDANAIEGAVDQVIRDNYERANEVREGNEKAIGWFVGQVMKATDGKVNPQAVNQLLRKKLRSD